MWHSVKHLGGYASAIKHNLAKSGVGLPGGVFGFCAKIGQNELTITRYDLQRR